MAYHINRTEDYHSQDIRDLAWELTVCNTMEAPRSPVREILSKNATYGLHLANYLFSILDREKIRTVAEIGGGYGFLMRDLLTHEPGLEAAMIDISPVLLAKQKQTLKDFDVTFVESDFFRMAPSFWKRHDLVILNEIVGDFPTACNVTRQTLENASHDSDPWLATVKKFHDDGYFVLPETEPINVNIGAMEAADRLCSLSIPYIFVSEHSCEARVIDYMRPFLDLTPTNNPERIQLTGHGEYTLRFSHIQSIGDRYGYKMIRGNYTDFIQFDFSHKIRYIMTSHSQKDEHEIIRQFIHDLYKYEYLLLIR